MTERERNLYNILMAVHQRVDQAWPEVMDATADLADNESPCPKALPNELKVAIEAFVDRTARIQERIERPHGGQVVRWDFVPFTFRR